MILLRIHATPNWIALDQPRLNQITRKDNLPMSANEKLKKVDAK